MEIKKKMDKNLLKIKKVVLQMINQIKVQL